MKRLAVGIAAALGVAGLAACGGSSSAAPAGSIGSLLDALPYSPSAVQDIVYVNYAGLWRSAGLPATPKLQQIAKGAGFDATEEALGAGLFGPQAAASDEAPVPGFDPLAASASLQVGTQLSWLQVPVDEAVTGKALVGVKGARVAHSPSGDLFDCTRVQTLLAPQSWVVDQLRPGWVYLPSSNEAFVFGSGPEDPSDVGMDRPVADSVGSQGVVRRFLALWPHADSITMGTDLAGGLPGRLSGPAREELLKDSGLDRVPDRIVFAGYAYVGGPVSSPTVEVATDYGSQSSATTAVATLGAYLRKGLSVSADLPFAKLLSVETISARDGMVVAEIRLHDSGALNGLVDTDDFPLFWTAG